MTKLVSGVPTGCDSFVKVELRAYYSDRITKVLGTERPLFADLVGFTRGAEFALSGYDVEQQIEPLVLNWTREIVAEVWKTQQSSE